MALFGKHLDSITEADLQALVDNEVAEDKLTEYKQELPGGGDSQRKEFLYDVTAFANASGGDLILGVKEQGSRAAALSGLSVDDESAEVQRLDSIIRAGVEPRIPGISYKFIPLNSGARVPSIGVNSAMNPSRRMKIMWCLQHHYMLL